MNRSGPLANQYCYHYSQTEGGPPTAKPTLIPRSPHPCLADEERDMNRGNAKRAPVSQPNETGLQKKTTVNPRGPHYSGTHSQRSSSTSTYSSMAESTSGESRYNHSGTVSPPRVQEYPPHHSTAQGQYQYRHQADPYEANLLQYSDGSGRHIGQTSARPQHTSQYQGRRTRENHSISPTPAYYAYRAYGTTTHQQQPGASYSPQSTQYRTGSRVALQHTPLLKAHSEERFRENHPYDVDSQRGFSSLHEIQDSYEDRPVTTRPQLTSLYRCVYPPGQYGEPTYSSAQYNPPPQTGYPHDYASSTLSEDAHQLSERTEAMRIHTDVDDDIEIVKQPTDQLVDLNERVVFTCEARVACCEEEPNLLWFKNREPLIGEIDSTYIIEETTERDTGTYHCLVTHPLDAAKQKESYSARLAIKTKAAPQPPLARLPKIVKQPLGRLTAVVGDPLEVCIQASGDEPLTYKWYRNSIPLQFAPSAVLRFPVASMTDSGDYCCRVANDHGSILSKVFTLEVTRAKAVITDLSDSYLQRVCTVIARQVRNPHELANLLGIKMTSSAFYKTLEDELLHLLKFWRDSKRGTKQQLLCILKQLHIGLVDVERSQVFGQPNIGKLAFVQQPQSTKVIYGQPVSLQVSVSSKTSSTRYQWYRNRGQLQGQTSPRLFISSVVESDVGEYVCMVNDRDLQIQSEPALVEILDGPPYRSVPSLINRGSNRTERPLGAPFEPKEQVAVGKDIPHSISIIEHPTSVEIESGDPLTLRCKATCSEHEGRLNYSWFFNGLLIKDEEQPEYVLNFFTDEDEGFYTCEVSNQYGSVKSKVAQVKAKQDSD